MTQVLEEFRKVVTQPLMDQDSALVLNAGVHLLKSTSFRNYQKIIKGFIRLLRDNYRGKVIWKTTPSLGKQTELYTGCSRRFHTEQVMETGKASCTAGEHVKKKKPIRARDKAMQSVPSAGKCMRVSRVTSGISLFFIGWKTRQYLFWIIHMSL